MFRMDMNNMDKDVAIELIELMIEFGDRLNYSVLMVQDNCTEEEFFLIEMLQVRLWEVCF